MSFLPPPATQNLANWLDVAIGDLIPSAQNRVRREIEAHFAEAVQNQLASGLTEPAAQAAALADFGSPKAAARRFRREYLTQIHANQIIKIVNTSSRDLVPWMFIGLLVLAIDGLTLGLLNEYSGNNRGWIYWFQAATVFLHFAVFLSVRIAAFLLAGRRITQPIRSQLLFMHYVSLLMLYTNFAIPGLYAPFAANIIVLFAVYAGTAWIFLRWRKKLQAARDDDFFPA